MRRKVAFSMAHRGKFKEALLSWAQQYNEVVWLDSNGHEDIHGSFDALLAVDAFTSLSTDFENAFRDLEEYQFTIKDWLFGYLSYDLKNDIERLSSANPDVLGFPDLFFFQPKKVIQIKGNKVYFMYLNIVEDDIESDFEYLSKLEVERVGIKKQTGIRIHMRIFKDEYFKRVKKVLHHIHRGDIYEANFCQEFYAENIKIDAPRTYQRLNEISRPPFGAFLKLYDKYLLCASPERYLKRKGTRIISQPIKGTAKRSLDLEEDKILRSTLENDPKERSENIMIVDLVRNDLSKSAIKGSVKVDELCRVFSFRQVHQMISTITSKVTSNKKSVGILKETFPMGSMTGAPKISAMQIIEDLESFKRGVYSGAVGYFNPKGDFDFNVVIRSILYNATKEYVSFSVGSAITAKANPEKEYEECLVKAKAMREVLEES